ncbi:MAG: glycosyltransferase family 2 protein [Candidatus Paceibacterota bacterium]
MNNQETKQKDVPKAVPAVAFIIFNRPDYTQKVFDQIRTARPKKLFVIADGPRNPAEALLCKETRAIIDGVDWDCQVQKNYSVINLGLKKRISSGLDWFFENVKEGIILEDDCLPHPSFFRFAAEMLEKYQHDERIMMISGDNFLPDLQIEDGYLFSRFFSIWGWATWRRAWKKYDVHMESWANPENKELIKKTFSQKYMAEIMIRDFDRAYLGQASTWDIQWAYACLMSGGYCIVPKVNLVSNIGLSGTHSEGGNQNRPTFHLYEEYLIYPEEIVHNTDYDETLYERDFKPKSQNIFQRFRLKIVAFVAKSDNAKRVYRSLFR